MDEPERRLRVVGDGTATAAPDRYVLLAALNAMAPDAAGALTRISQLVDAAQRVLQARGLGAGALQTKDLRLHDWFDKSEQQVTARVASYQLEVTVSDVDQVGSVLADLATALGDAMQLNGIRPQISDLTPLHERAQQEAVARAGSKARTLAQAAGVTLGPVLTVEEHPAGAATLPGAASAVAMSGRGGQVVVPPVAVEPGVLSVHAFVTVVYGIE